MAFTQEIVDFSGLPDPEISRKLAELNIPLTSQEALKIQNDMLGRAPSLSELILFSIQGSEHSSYKSSRLHLKQFTTTGPDVVLGAKEDAGVVAVATDNERHRWCVVMSHESHNHPSQIVPYEGAATGVGGNVRDVMCMGAEVIACTDSFRFGDINNNKTKWIHNGVVAGIAGYGNPLGIPNIGGDLYYHEGYNDNCLVTLVTLGIVREDHIIHSYAPKDADGYDLILIGKPTDNSGFGGASFASLELEEEKKEQNKGAVQEPNAFLERHLLKSTYALFEILKEKEWPESITKAIMGHATYTGVPRDTDMAKALFAVDELTGFIFAVTYVRPSKSIFEVKPKSVKKKLKQKSFAASVLREDIFQSVEELGVDLTEHIQFVIDALKEKADELGLRGTVVA